MTIRKEKVKLNTMRNEIPDWLENLKKMFKTISKKELLLSRKKVDYKITLKIKEIKSSLLISIKLEEQ